MFKINAKRNDFRNEIRKKHIFQRMNQIRINNDIELTLTPDELARKMGLPVMEDYHYSMS